MATKMLQVDVRYEAREVTGEAGVLVVPARDGLSVMIRVIWKRHFVHDLSILRDDHRERGSSLFFCVNA